MRNAALNAKCRGFYVADWQMSSTVSYYCKDQGLLGKRIFKRTGFFSIKMWCDKGVFELDTVFPDHLEYNES